MTFLAALFISLAASAAPVKIITIQPGARQNLTRQEIRQFGSQSIELHCESEPECHIKYEYVGKKYGLKMPNGKNHGFYKTQQEAITAASGLISAKVCDRLVLADEDNTLKK